MTEEGWPEVTLYYGHNGAHAFWESPGMRPGPGGLLLMQTAPVGWTGHGKGWTAEVRRLGLPNEYHSAPTLEELTRMLARLLGWRIVLSDSAFWEEPTGAVGSGLRRMNLVALDPTVARPYQPLDL